MRLALVHGTYIGLLNHFTAEEFQALAPASIIMLSSTYLNAALALVALTDASPIEPRGLAFTVLQTIAKPFIKSGPAAMAATYEKFHKQAPADVSAAAANNDGTVTATPEQYDSEYLCPVSIGGQTLNLDFDTGSSDL